MMSAAETIKKIRLHLFLERSDLAKVLGISSSAISYYESGKRLPKLYVIKELMRLAKENGMEFSIEDFMSNKND